MRAESSAFPDVCLRCAVPQPGQAHRLELPEVLHTCHPRRPHQRVGPLHRVSEPLSGRTGRPHLHHRCRPSGQSARHVLGWGHPRRVRTDQAGALGRGHPPVACRPQRLVHLHRHAEGPESVLRDLPEGTARVGLVLLHVPCRRVRRLCTGRPPGTEGTRGHEAGHERRGHPPGALL